MDGWMIVIFLVVPVFFIVIAYLQHQRDTKAWTAFAQARQWRYTASDRQFFRNMKLEPFGRGSGRVARHVVEGTWAGMPVRVFRYFYTTGSGKNRTTHRHSAVQFDSRAVFPPLEVYNGWRLRLTKDIQFESDAFNDRFDVRGPDERFAFAIVHPRFMAALLDGALGEDNLAIDKGVFTLWRKDFIEIGEVDLMLHQLTNVVSMVPTHVWRDGQVAPPQLTS